jgi:hypothetical protein
MSGIPDIDGPILRLLRDAGPCDPDSMSNGSSQSVGRDGGRAATRPLLLIVRYVTPVGVVLAGILVFLLAPHSSRFEGAAAFIGAGLSVLLLNVLYRAGVRGDVDRDDEERARGFFDDYGYWPDEEPPNQRTKPARHQPPAVQ